MTNNNNQRDAVAKGRQFWVSKTHCKQGHKYAGDNLYVYPNGRRGCRTCRRNKDMEYYLKRRLAS